MYLFLLFVLTCRWIGNWIIKTVATPDCKAFVHEPAQYIWLFNSIHILLPRLFRPMTWNKIRYSIARWPFHIFLLSFILAYNIRTKPSCLMQQPNLIAKMVFHLSKDWLGNYVETCEGRKLMYICRGYIIRNVAYLK